MKFQSEISNITNFSTRSKIGQNCDYSVNATLIKTNSQAFHSNFIDTIGMAVVNTRFHENFKLICWLKVVLKYNSQKFTVVVLTKKNSKKSVKHPRPFNKKRKHALDCYPTRKIYVRRGACVFWRTKHIQKVLKRLGNAVLRLFSLDIFSHMLFTWL
jgi:hypothetical protein